MVVQEGYSLDTIPYVDNPEIKVDEHESTQMPFRYVKGKTGEVVMPEVSSFGTVHRHLACADLFVRRA